MAAPLRVYLEVGQTRVFAAAIDWPGWCRSGRDEASAIETLAGYGSRYAAAMGEGARFLAPAAADGLEIVERLEGGSGTDFGVPGVAPAADATALEDDDELTRLTGLLGAAWTTFHRVAKAAGRRPLRTGPRGGGRQVSAMIGHAAEAEAAYLYRLGGHFDGTGQTLADLAAIHEAALALLASRARDEPIAMGRRTAPLWPPRYYVRRSAWHALDHAWEIEDRLS
ncbi:MAG TPA: hypothetical protein VFW92_07770 [Candidatus Limnocylindrales bacterium]|nr:hypothetical protein [Candidatus Limnocylindrales bacterium]